jgi:thiol-disulfide isomerase/thioredoxin
MFISFAHTKFKAVQLAVFLSTAAAGQQQVDPSSLLKGSRTTYARAKSYQIEMEHWEDFKGELSGNWSHSFQTGIVGSRGRYRFEAKGAGYSWLQTSNGNFEWIYDATSQKYMQQRTPADGEPSHFGKDQLSYGESQLVDAQELMQHVAQRIGSIRDPQIVGSEVLPTKTGNSECWVIRGPGRYMSGGSPDTKWELTLWIERGSNYVHKIEERWEGQLVLGQSARYAREVTELYSVVNLDDSNVPLTVFEFHAPAAAKLMANFTATPLSFQQQRARIVGKVAPEVIFRSPRGEPVALSSMRGRPALIEFWATWCGPCVSAFPQLKRLYSQLTRQGVAVITVDEDEEPEKAASFLAAHGKVPWSNYHDDGEINRSLPGDGLPQFVLIDAARKIVYQRSGFDEHELRTAIARLVY